VCELDCYSSRLNMNTNLLSLAQKRILYFSNEYSGIQYQNIIQTYNY